jgi:hypothetical protein
MPGGYEVDDPHTYFSRTDRATDPDAYTDPSNDVHNPVEVTEPVANWTGQYVVRISHGDTFEYAEGAPFRYIGGDVQTCVTRLVREGHLPGAAQYADPDRIERGYASGDATVMTLEYDMPCYNPSCSKQWRCVATFAFLTVYAGQ